MFSDVKQGIIQYRETIAQYYRMKDEHRRADTERMQQTVHESGGMDYHPTVADNWARMQEDTLERTALAVLLGMEIALGLLPEEKQKIWEEVISI